MQQWLTHFTRENPIYEKEMGLRWRRGRLWVVPAATVGVTVALMLLAATYGLTDPDFLAKGYPRIAAGMGSVIAMAVALLVTPALTAAALAGERQQRTLEMLIITRITSWQIVMGKFLPSLLPVLLAVVPCVCLSFFFAVLGASLDSNSGASASWVGAYLQCVTAPLAAIFAACTSMFFSSVCPNIASATAWSYAVTLGTYLIARHGLRLLWMLGLIKLDPLPDNVPGLLGRAAIAWIVFIWLAVAGLFAARWRLEREAELL